jgi:hypothetical protein
MIQSERLYDVTQDYLQLRRQMVLQTVVAAELQAVEEARRQVTWHAETRRDTTTYEQHVRDALAVGEEPKPPINSIQKVMYREVAAENEIRQLFGTVERYGLFAVHLGHLTVMRTHETGLAITLLTASTADRRGSVMPAKCQIPIHRLMRTGYVPAVQEPNANDGVVLEASLSRLGEVVRAGLPE